MLIIYKANIYTYAPPTAKAELKNFFGYIRKYCIFAPLFKKHCVTGIYAFIPKPIKVVAYNP